LVDDTGVGIHLVRRDGRVSAHVQPVLIWDLAARFNMLGLEKIIFFMFCWLALRLKD
jgi:hypothetical protein